MRPHTPHTPHTPRIGFANWAVSLAFLAFVCFAPAANAQQGPPYPSPRLARVFPPGAKAGTTVEVTVSGDYLDDVKSLYFSSPGIKAVRIPDPPPPKVKDKKKKPPPPPKYPIKFKVSVPANTPLGLHDIRVIGKWGISNPRAFAVGNVAEIEEKEPNSDTKQAQRVDSGTLVNGTIDNKVDVDYYTFGGKAGQPLVIHCAASSIDSRLSAYLQLYDSRGRELASNRFYRDRDALLSLVLPADGDYLVRACEFAYQNGGPESIYRLSISNGPWIDAVYPPVAKPGQANGVTLIGRGLPGGKPLPSSGHGPALQELAVSISPAAAPRLDFRGCLLPAAGALNGFGYRLGGSNPVFVAYADAPIVLDSAKNTAPEAAQEVAIPSNISGRIEARGDRDYYAFAAKKGEVVIIDGLGDRLRSPIDLFARIKKAEDGKTIAEFDNHPDIPPVMDHLFTYTDDPVGRVVIPADGKYRLQIGSRDASARGGPREVYCVRLRHEEPDFQLVVVANHDYAAGLTLRRGSSHDIQVVCFRRDGFDGEITLTAEGLPPGVSCEPQVLGPNLHEGSLVLTATNAAKDWAGPITIKGTAAVNGKPLVREARAACLVYPSANNIPAVSRLARSLCLAVREPGPFRITAQEKTASVPVGGSLTLKLKVDALMKDFKQNVAIDLTAGPVQSNGRPIRSPKVNIAPGKEGSVKIQMPSKTPPGEYSFVFRGYGKHSMIDPADAKKKKKKSLEFAAVSPPVRVTVYDSVGDLQFTPKSVALKPGSEIPVVVRVKRLHNFKGEFTLEVIPPSGSSGVSVARGKIAANAVEARLAFKVGKNVKPAKERPYRVRASAKIGNVTLNTDAELLVSIVSPSAPGTGPKAGATTALPLIAASSSGWKYAISIKGEDWIKPGFDAKAWKSVKAPFGNGEPEIATRKGTTVPEKGAVLYARRAFEVSADLLKQKGAAFRLQVASDDGAVVYLNGKLLDNDANNHEFSYWNREAAIPVKLLLPGKNVLAVRVNNTSGSSDVFLDVAITADVPKGKK